MPNAPRRAPDRTPDAGAHDLNAAIHRPDVRDTPPTPPRVAALAARWDAIRDADVPVPPPPAWTPDTVPAVATDTTDPHLEAAARVWLLAAADTPPQTCDVCGAPYRPNAAGRLEVVHRLERHEAATLRTHEMLEPTRPRRVQRDDDEAPPVRPPRPSALAAVRRALGERDDD